MLAFALFIEFWTAAANNVAHVGGTAVGAPLLFILLIADIAALVAVSISGRNRDE